MTDLTPGSPEWLKIVSASKVSSILGVSHPKGDSPLTMWHRMRGEMPPIEETDAMERGTLLEPAILMWWRKRHPEYDEYLEQVIYRHEEWAIATPDMVAVSYERGVKHVVEAKSSVDDNHWGEPGTAQIPPYYYPQTQFQMALANVDWCYMPMIGTRLEFAEYLVPADPDYQAMLMDYCKAFYDSLSGDVPPELDDRAATYDYLRRRHPDIEPGKSVEVTADEAVQYLQAIAARKDALAAERGIKNVILDRMGDAQFAEYKQVPVARRQAGKYGVTLQPSVNAEKFQTMIDNVETTEIGSDT